MDFATKFRHPIGAGNETPIIDGDGYYVALGFNEINEAIGSHHLGVDWNGDSGGDTDLGHAVYAVANAVVVALVADKRDATAGFGNYVVLRHDLPTPRVINGVSVDKVHSLYAHLDTVEPLAVGASVSIGQRLGTIGKSGYSDVAHLHFEMTRGDTLPTSEDGYRPAGASAEWIDPIAFIAAQITAGGLPSISVVGGSVLEGRYDFNIAEMPFEVRLSAPSSETVSVLLRLSGGTATSGYDVNGLRIGNSTYGGDVRLSFAPGETSKFVEARVLGDEAVEADEAVVLELLSPQRETRESW